MTGGIISDTLFLRSENATSCYNDSQYNCGKRSLIMDSVHQRFKFRIGQKLTGIIFLFDFQKFFFII